MIIISLFIFINFQRRLNSRILKKKLLAIHQKNNKWNHPNLSSFNTNLKSKISKLSKIYEFHFKRYHITIYRENINSHGYAALRWKHGNNLFLGFHRHPLSIIWSLRGTTIKFIYVFQRKLIGNGIWKCYVAWW